MRYLKLLALPALLLSMMLSAMPAFAASAPPKLSPQASKHLHVVSPDYYYCDPEWIYDNISFSGNNFVGISPVYSGYNGTPYNATETFTATVTGTVAVWTTVGGSVDVSAIVAGVDATGSVTVYASISTSIGHSFSITVPPYKTGYGQYGVMRKITYGHYYYLDDRCMVTSDYGTVQARSPWSPSWNTWLG